MIARIVAAAVPVAVGAVTLVLFALVAARVRLLSPLAALGVLSLALIGGGTLSLAVGLLAWLRAGQGADGPTRAAALLALLTGLVLVGVILFQGARAAGRPGIHDITTRPDDPPALVAARDYPDNRGRDLDYPHGPADSAEQQRRAYPDIAPILLDVAPAEAWARARRAAVALGWAIVAGDAGAGTFEATAETPVLRFVDDVAVRVRGREGGSVIDVRSLSRVGVGDMGANAARIRRFREALHGNR